MASDEAAGAVTDTHGDGLADGGVLRFATFLAPALLPVYRAVTAYVGRRLDLPTSLAVGSSFTQFAAGEVDVGFICGLPYVELMREEPPPVGLLAAPVLTGARYQGRPIYFSDVVVRADSPVRAFADLRGRSWSYNDVDSHSGYNITRHRLVELGETRGYFGRVVEGGSHQRSIELVAAGEVEASAIDSQVLAVELREHPSLEGRLRVIDTLGPSPIQPVVAASRLPDSLRRRVGEALLAMADDPAAKDELAFGFVDRFVAVSDSDYDPVRRMLGAAEAAGFMTLV